MRYLETQPYAGPVIVARRSFTGDRLSEQIVEQDTISNQLRGLSTMTPATTAKATLRADWHQWRADRQARFEREVNQ